MHCAEIEDTDERVTPAAPEETSLRLYPAGTVLVAMYGGFNQIGRTGLLRKPAAVNQAISAIQVSPTKLWPDYLLAVLNLSVHHWKWVASSSRKDPNITAADVRGFPIAIPPMNEQRAIAAALRDIAGLTGSLDALIAKKRDLKQAAMQQLLTDQFTKLLDAHLPDWRERRKELQQSTLGAEEWSL
ncbi:restriction endonuclease subunit S [Ramlibacter sp. USB13]|uniref:Restriction endonuclease subunit S n=1 Tax=Ramlibacter cellulosilyticus TaxID=2764187 RepID=A0A923SG79_9BURK|nr:restriction endonuclease subunit S [Ramlibacter cellulosilyticus]MBC5784662.1 restriction endonuclease subunit S [Ramlibacter cellulosilyticus]